MDAQEKIESVEPRKMLTAEDILSADDLQVVEVDVPEWGGVVRLRPLTAQQAIKFAEEAKENKGALSAVNVAAMCIVDATGSPMFNAEQLEKLKSKSLRAMMRIQKEALRINGLDEKAETATKNV
jgi:hypothetical protein